MTIVFFDLLFKNPITLFPVIPIDFNESLNLISSWGWDFGLNEKGCKKPILPFGSKPISINLCEINW